MLKSGRSCDNGVLAGPDSRGSRNAPRAPGASNGFASFSAVSFWVVSFWVVSGFRPSGSCTEVSC